MKWPWQTITAQLSEVQADSLAERSRTEWHVIELQPPRTESAPATIAPVMSALRELKTCWLGLRNDSPTIAVELSRPSPDRLRYQIAVPSNRLERKLRTHLTGQIPGIGFTAGTTGLPVMEGDTVGGAFLAPGRDDWYPLDTDQERPVLNAVVGALHPHAMPQTRVVIQVLLRPWAGHPVHQWWYKRRAYKQLGYLKKEKEGLWGGRSATKREAKQANRIEAKSSQPLWWASIRLVVIGAGDQTLSRVRELASAFTPLEDPLTNQYLAAEPVTPLRENRLIGFTETVAARQFGRWHRRFRLTDAEVGTLCAVPDRDQENLQRAAPR